MRRVVRTVTNGNSRTSLGVGAGASQSGRARRGTGSILWLLATYASALVMTAATPGPARAQQAGATAARELTLDEALALGRKSNRSLIAERARLEQAQALIDRAWTSLFPTIAAQGRYTHNNIEFSFSGLTIQPLDQLDGIVSVSIPLLVPAAYPGLRSVKMTAVATKEGVHAAENEVLFGVAQTFYAAAIADEVLVARQSSIDVARATVENAKTRFAAGAVTKVDVDRAQLAFLRAEQAEREAQLGREQTYRALGTLIRIQQPFKVRVSATDFSGNDSSSPTGPSTDKDLAAALQLRPEFRALEATVQAQEAERSGHAWRWAPSLSGFGNARAFNYDNFARKSYSWAVGAQLDWLIYDAGVRDTQRRLAAAQVAETMARADVLRDTIGDDLANGRRQVDTKRQAQKTFEHAVALARETIELVRIQYEAGQATQIDLLSAQDNLVSAQLSVAQAHLDLAVADLTLRRAAGTFPAR